MYFSDNPPPYSAVVQVQPASFVNRLVSSEQEDLMSNIYSSSSSFIPYSLANLTDVGLLIVEKEVSSNPGWKRYTVSSQVDSGRKVLFTSETPVSHWNPNEDPPQPIVLLDSQSGQEAVHLSFAAGYGTGCLRTVAFEVFCSPFDEVTVGKELVGYIQQELDCCFRNNWLEVKNSSNKLIFSIEFDCSCCNPKYFITDTDRVVMQPMGEIETSQWCQGGCCWSCCRTYTSSRAIQFKLQFPDDLDIQSKVLLLGSIFLLDYGLENS